MTFILAELRRQESLDKVPGNRRPNCATAETNKVHVIILDALSRREMVENQRGSNTWNLVGADRRAHAAAAYSYPTLNLTGCMPAACCRASAYRAAATSRSDADASTGIG